MHYALSSSLGSMSGLNTDKLALDLQFATDKTLTARRGPTPTFTRASTGTFVGSNGLIQSAALNVARFDHDPITLACKGLLIEEPRTNSLQHSANFKNTTSSSYWENVSATTVTVDQTTSPDGGNNADLLVTSTTSFDCYSRRAVGYTGSTQYTYSIFLKQGPSSHRYVGLYIGVGITATQFPFFDFNNPTVVQIPSGTMNGTINSTRVDAYPNGWYRVSVTFTTAATPVTNYAGVYISTSNGTLASSSTAGLNAYIWGIQLELGSFPTSYIPTTTESVVRSADLCSINSLSPWYNFTEGTMLAQFSSMSPAATLGNRAFASISNGTYNNVIFLGKNAGNDSFLAYIVRTGSTQSNFQVSGYLPNVVNKTSISFATNNVAFSVNGSLTTDNTAVIPTTLSRLRFYDPTVSGGGHPSGHIQLFRYYKKRLSNAKLQLITT